MAKPGRLRKVDPKINSLCSHIWQGEIETAKQILEELGLEVTDGFGRTALINAVIDKQTSLITWLIEKGANLNHQDRNGYSALHFIAQNGEMDLARLFLEKGANPNVGDIHGNTPLWTTVFNSKNEKRIVELLLRHKVNPAIVNKHGQTAQDRYTSLYGTDIRDL
jgi:uncharacterized protein